MICPSSSMSSLVERALLRDPWYGAYVRQGATHAQLLRAGFIDDGLDRPIQEYPWFAPSLLTTPLPSRRAENAVVLLTTGAFSPLHQGHIEMMRSAKHLMESQGKVVLACYFSPSHDHYVSVKNHGTAAMPAHQRVALAQASVETHDDFFVCPWESQVSPCNLNFTDVVMRLQAYLHYHHVRAKVVYVFGSDNHAFAHAFVHRGTKEVSYVCVPRTAASSTAIRNGHVAHLAPLLQEKPLHTWTAPTPHQPEKYWIREDITESMGRYRYIAPLTQSPRAQQHWRDLLTEVLDPYLQAQQLQAHWFSTPNQLQKAPVLSLDTWTPAEHQLQVSRVFTLAGGQYHALRRAPRPGSPSMAEQIDQLPSGVDWELLDDDKASGHTMAWCAQQLQARGHAVSSRQHTWVAQEPPPWDVVDARDFLLGTEHGGLVCNNPWGPTSIRVPYMAPFVQLTSRAKLSTQDTLDISRKLWEANITWWAQWGAHVRVHDLPKYTQDLWTKGLGMVPHTTLVEVASQMHAQLELWHR